MSLRYTGEATMDEPALRDVERWKDKIEVRLDNRQVFFLFFGSAMVACMLFVLGVIVGKRLESRGRAEAPVIEDPLAALDRFSAPASATPAGTALAFPRALINNPPVKGERLAAKPTLTSTLPVASRKTTERMVEKPVERTVERSVAVAPAEPAEAAVAPRELPAKKLALVESPAPSARKAAPTEAPDLASTVKKTALLPHPVAAVAAPVGRPAPTAAVQKSAPLAAKPAAAPTKPLPATPSKMVAVAAKTPLAAPAHVSGKGNFLLQLSSFQDRAEADAFAHRFSGQNAYVVASEVPGKGLWYRVRVGSYGTMKDAASAKIAFEHEHGVIAYVAGTGPAQ